MWYWGTLNVASSSDFLVSTFLKVHQHFIVFSWMSMFSPIVFLK